jgi:hypothetical protein
MVLTVSFALFPVIGLCCHRRLADTLRDLTPTIEASEPHDFAVRNVARSSVAQLASIASRPYVRDDRETPLCVGRDGSDIEVIWVGRESEYFCKEGWTVEQVICPSGKINRLPGGLLRPKLNTLSPPSREKFVAAGRPTFRLCHEIEG